MAWERRQRGGLYLYQSVRVGGQVRKRYLGTGPAAEQHARLAARRLEERRAEREALSAEQTQVTAADAALREARGLADLLLQAVLLCAGFHCHHGGWRRRCADAAHGDEG